MPEPAAAARMRKTPRYVEGGTRDPREKDSAPEAQKRTGDEKTDKLTT